MVVESVDPLRAYTPEEIADRLSLHVYTVRKLLRERKLRGVKVGVAWRVPAEALEEYLRGGTPGGQQ